MTDEFDKHDEKAVVDYYRQAILDVRCVMVAHNTRPSLTDGTAKRVHDSGVRYGRQTYFQYVA